MSSESEIAENLTQQVKTSSDKAASVKVDALENYFSQKLEPLGNNEEKLALLLGEMKLALSQEGQANFKLFWRAKQLALTFFKESLHPLIRSQYWQQFTELSDEGRHLKDHLEEESAFAIEQIQLAVTALAEDLKKYDLLVAQVSEEMLVASMDSAGLKKEDYLLSFKEMTILNLLSSRANSLRKEILQREMRSRDKNRFFKELSSIADVLFPKRRERMEQMSQKFQEDVEGFVQRNFQEGVSKQKPYFLLREEIKGLQGLAKVLTLNTKTFSSTRQQLSECWNQLREVEKERKKEIAKSRLENQEKITEAKNKIEEFQKICSTAASLSEVEGSSEEISQWIKTLGLRREEMKILFHSLDLAKAPLKEKQRAGKEDAEKKKKDEQVKKKEILQTLKEKIKIVTQEASALALEDLLAQRKALQEEFSPLSLSPQEKQLFERLLSPLEGMIEDRKIMASPEGESLQEYRALIAQKKKRQIEIKKQLDEYRKTMNGSGMDFEKAMMYRELMGIEKTRLEKAEEEIGALEEKIEKMFS